MVTSTNDREGRRRNPSADGLALRISLRTPGKPLAMAENSQPERSCVSAPSTAPTGRKRRRDLMDRDLFVFSPKKTEMCSSHLEMDGGGTRTVT